MPVNMCKLTLSIPRQAQVSVGDEVTVKLGYDSSLTTVFTGVVSEAAWQIDRVNIRAESQLRNLLMARYNRYFDQPKAGDIVDSVCSEANISTNRVDAGLDFSYYAIGNQGSVYDQIKYLATLSGFDLYADADDKVVFAPFIPINVHLFQFGMNILDLRISLPEETIEGIEVLGESPASQGQGADAASWLTKKDVKGSAGGTSGIVHRIAEPAIRTQQNALQAAQNILTASKSHKTGHLKAIGAEEVALGDSINISGMPVSAQNGTYKIVAIQQQVHPKKGFITQMRIEAI